jgi:hypothetical protein
MASAARRRQRFVPVYAQVVGALVAAAAVPTLALAGTATPVTANPITSAASPDGTGTSAPGDPTGDPTPNEPTASPTPTDPVDPTPTEPPPTEPPATQSPTTEPPSTEPPVGSPPIGPTQSSPVRPPGPSLPLPTIQRPGQQAPTKPGQPRLGVFVSTSDVALTSTYWNRPASFVELRVTVENTGDVAERVRLRYTLPLGVTDAGTRGCYRTGNRSYECAAWTADAGARWSTRLKLRIAGDAWKAMPLNGSVQVTATAPGHPDAGEVGDDQGFAVLFPAGPPVAGMTLSATEVVFDLSGQPTSLEVRLGNTGKIDATGSVEVILPPGLTVPTPPEGCRASGDRHTTCYVGRIRAGRSALVRLPVSATAEAQRMAPLAGAVVGIMKPRAGGVKRMQLSFRITAAAAMSTPPPADATATGSDRGVAAGGRAAAGAGSDVRRLAITLIGVSMLLVLLALALAVTSLRRRLGEEPAPPTAPAAAPVD